MTRTDLDSLFKKLESCDDVIACDTETTDLHVQDGRDYLMGISVAFHDGVDLVSAYFPIRHPVGNNLSIDERLRLFAILKEKPLAFHNAKFDLHSLATVGFVPVGKLYDTMVMAHMVDENSYSKELDYLSKEYLNESKVVNFRKAAVKAWDEWKLIPAECMAPYARQDTILTRRLFTIFKNEMESQSLHTLWNIESRFLRLLTLAENRGVLLDQARCRDEAAVGRARMDEIGKELGIEPSKPSQLATFLLEELKLPVLKRSRKTGKPSFDKEVMEEYDLILSNTEDTSAKLLQEFRGWQKSVGSSYQGWVDRVSPDGRLRPNYKLHGTRTGRLSCEDPNLQQIPRTSDKPWNKNAKPCFIAPEGYSLIEFDYSQLEYRVAAAYAREGALLEDFANGIDPFIRTAREVFGEFNSTNRQRAKTLTYSIQYGAGVPRVSHALGLEPATAAKTIARFYELYPGIRRVSQRATAMAERDGYVKYWTGRRRHFNRNESPHKAFNSVVQGGCAELVKRKMLELYDLVDSPDCQMLLQVHDSIVFQIKNEVVDDVKPIIEKCMENWEEAPEVPLKVEGKLWGT